MVFNDIISPGFSIKVQSGNNTLFWKDVWMGDQNLETAFPRLFSVSTQKDAKVGEVFNGDNQSWELLFRRRLFIWEEGQLEVLKQMLNGAYLIPNGVDYLKWNWDHISGMFSVKSFYDKWENSFNDLNHIGPHCKLIWKNLCPFKVEVFVWQAIQDKLATGSELLKRGLLYNNVGNAEVAGLCAFCRNNVETVEHLLVNCGIAWNVWSSIIKWWGLSWVCPGSIYNLMSWWLSNKFTNLEKGIWDIYFFAVMWSLWLERNLITFQGCALDTDKLVDKIQTRVSFWTKANFDLKTYSVEDFKRCLSGIRKIKTAKIHVS